MTSLRLNSHFTFLPVGHFEVL